MSKNKNNRRDVGSKEKLETNPFSIKKYIKT